MGIKKMRADSLMAILLIILAATRGLAKLVDDVDSITYSVRTEAQPVHWRPRPPYVPSEDLRGGGLVSTTASPLPPFLWDPPAGAEQCLLDLNRLPACSPDEMQRSFVSPDFVVSHGCCDVVRTIYKDCVNVRYKSVQRRYISWLRHHCWSNVRTTPPPPASSPPAHHQLPPPPVHHRPPPPPTHHQPPPPVHHQPPPPPAHHRPPRSPASPVHHQPPPPPAHHLPPRSPAPPVHHQPSSPPPVHHQPPSPPPEDDDGDDDDYCSKFW